MSSEPLTPRALTASDVEQLYKLDEIAFHTDPYSPEQLALYATTHEVERMIGVFDGPALVGSASIFTLELSVPGGHAPMAGVSWVSVLPTHRRRGILTSLMRHQLDGLHTSGGEAIAGLTASEPPIYGRFGYGQATSGVTLCVPRHKGDLRLPPGTDEIRVRLVSGDDSFEARQDIFNREFGKRPGTLSRSPAWGRVYSSDLPEWRVGSSVMRFVLAERDGDPVGYALYRTKSGSGPGQVTIVELAADGAAAYAALLRYLLGIDLIATIDFDRPLPADSPVLHLLTDVRAAEPRLHDGLYLRLVDVDRALASRTYATPIDIVIEVADDFCPWNTGRWRLVGDEKGSACQRTTAGADLAIAVRDLGSAFLGGVTLSALANAGLVEERRSGAVAEASRAFASDIAPWLSFGF